MTVAIRLPWVLVLGCASTTDPVEPIAPPIAKYAEPLAAIVATCTSCDGEVQLRHRGRPYWESVGANGSLRDGDWVRVVRGAARLRLVSGGELEVDEQSTLFVEAEGGHKRDGEKVTGVQLAMLGGGAAGTLQGAEGPIHIRTLEGSVELGAPGPAALRLAPGENGAVEVTAIRGELILKGRDGERRIEAPKPADPPTGDKAPVVATTTPPPSTTVPPDRRPPPVRPKVERIRFPQSVAPAVDAKFKCNFGAQIPLRWSPVAGATKYRVMVAKDMSFRTVVLNQELAGTEAKFAPLAPGTYVWRVAARDGRGYGEFGFARRLFCQ